MSFPKGFAALLIASAVSSSAFAGPIDWSQFRNCTSAQCSTDVIKKFHLDSPIWSAETVYDEPVLPTGAPIKLWRSPTAILEVRDRTTGKVFTAGSDYSMIDGSLVVDIGSTIKSYPNFPYTMDKATPPNFQPFTKAGRSLRIAVDYQSHQIAVTYSAGAIVSGSPLIGSLPITARKIAAREPVAATFYGDSITRGANASGTVNQSPHQPGWVDLLAALLSNGGDGTFYWRNVAVGGWNSAEGLAGLRGKVNTTASDLVEIGYGMNDATAGISSHDYEKNVRAMIVEIREKAPATEILLVSSWLGNGDWKAIDNTLIMNYRAAQARIVANTDGVAMADMTSLSENILAGKSYYDLTSNGVNHPADFMHVGYAQIVARAIR